MSVFDAAILLDGDGSGHGHHRHGSGKGKAEFPEGWTERDVVDWVNAIVDHPSGGGDLGGGFYLFGGARGVSGRVILRQYGRWFVATAHPL